MPRQAYEGYRPLWIAPFLEALATGLTISDACRAAGISRVSVHNRKRTDRKFRLAYDAAMTAGAKLLEKEAWERAGWNKEEVIHAGIESVDPPATCVD
jgi:hypothetical protein